MRTKVRLNQEQKEDIGRLYETGEWHQKTLADMYLVSERTIGRVLREAGVLVSLPRVQESEFEMVQLLKKYRVNVIGLRMMLRVAYPEVM